VRWIERLDWKIFAVVVHAHNREHIAQIERTLAAVNADNHPLDSPAGAEDALIAYCRTLPAATEDVKWGHDLIFSVGGKMFAGFQLPAGQPLAFKTDPLVFASLTASNAAFEPAPYMARHHWVSVARREQVPEDVLRELLGEAHRLVAQKLSATARRKLGLP
jgi:predicted DNA-binding protein (MmcQ/YjbR family)